MNSKFTLIFIVLSFGIVTLSSADYATGLNAYKKGDYKTALMEWQPLAEKGLSEAQYNLAGMFAKGYGVVVDDERAVYWYKKSAEQGYPKAQHNLALMYLMGTGATQSYEKAKHWLQLSYENGIEESEAIWNKYELWNY